jgi:hypothetical protein
VKASRRQFLGLGAVGAAAAFAPSLARAAIPSGLTAEKARLLRAARRELDRHAQHILHRDRVGIADFSPYSASPRFYLVDLEGGDVSELLVTHGRGSDPRHLGWLQHFSNVPGSNATSRGAYLTAEQYHGVHGAAMRLDGLEADNSNARDRAIVVHAAWYAEPEMIAKHGKLGRSEGCFAFPERRLGQVLDRLGPGRLLFADKLAAHRPLNAPDEVDDGAERIWPSTTFPSAA